MQRSLLSVGFFYRGELAAGAGLEAPQLLGNQACVWSWTGKSVLQCPKSFLQCSRIVLKNFQQLYPQLYAACDVRYRTAGNYLRHLGARPVGKPFYLAGNETLFQCYQW